MMNQKEEVTRFVSNLLQIYNIYELGLFDELDDDEISPHSKELFEYEEIDEPTLNRLSVLLGLTKQEILDADLEAGLKYWFKYPFFKYYSEYCALLWSNYRFRTQDSKNITSEHINNPQNLKLFEKYNYKSVYDRMISELKKTDSFVPGTFHVNAEIEDLTIDTTEFIEYPNGEAMLESLITMFDRLKYLFEKAVESVLPDDEINELNFLATVLRATDYVMPSVNITYHNIQIYKKAYKSETYKEFTSYVKIRRNDLQDLLHCKEFYDNKELVQAFVNVFPKAKAVMRGYALEATKFSCEFCWSDADEIVWKDFLTPEQTREYMPWVPEECISENYTEKERTHIYVDKTEEEIGDLFPFVNKIKTISGPKSKGGVCVPFKEVDDTDLNNNVLRIQRRVDAKFDFKDGDSL